MNKILVLGNFGYRSNHLDGQTVKTRDVYRLVTEQVKGKVDYYDTEDFRYKKLSIFKMFWKVIRSRTLVYLPAHNNLKYIFPIIYVLSILFRVKIHYFVVGGWLREFLQTLPLHRFMLARIVGIHVETQRLKKELEEYYKFKHVDIFPNFRFFSFDPSRTESAKLRIVFMARVNKMKGLDWIFNLADYLSKNNLEDKYSMTFYGPINEEDREYFETNLRKYSFAEYRGVLQPDHIYETLCNYDVMLLPTHFYTEGLPGSIVDAYISGIPVIATEWKHAHEFIEHGKSGFLIPFENGQNELIEKVVKLESNRDLLARLQAGALVKRQEFTPPLYPSKSLNIIFVSRVEQSKGLDILKDISSVLLSKGLGKHIQINVYGKKTDDYFDTQLSEHPLIHYKGILQPTEVIPMLENSDVLIFPSHYEGEGCPGILVEALSAGLPIIASDWKYNNEFVEHGVNGFLCETYCVQQYVNAIMQLYSDSVLRSIMSRHSYRKSLDFSVDKARVLLQSVF